MFRQAAAFRLSALPPVRPCMVGGWDVARVAIIFPRPGQVAQLVEQGTENPRVGGSIPSLAMSKAP